MIDEKLYTITQLDNGMGWFCRPKDSTGSTGWSPYPWTATFGVTPEQAREKFIDLHKPAMVKAKLKGDL